MKRLAMVFVVLMALGVCAQADAFVLVYNAFGFVQAVDTASNDQDLKMVNGYIVLNINETDGTADESSVVLFGRVGWRNRVFTVTDDAVVFTPFGNFVTLAADTGAGSKIILTGRLRSRNVGLAARVAAATVLDGAITFEEAQLFDLEESLVGAGAMQAILNNFLTRNANVSANTVDEVVDAILTNLEARGFQELVEEEDPEDPPVPN